MAKVEDFSQHILEGARYHTEDLDLSEVGQFGEHIDPYALPSQPLADNLVQLYFTTMHQVYPVFLEPSFWAQYNLFRQNLRLPEFSIAWLTMLNTIFAIGAVYAHYTQSEWRGRANDHVTYFMRARSLNAEPIGLINVPKLEQVQVTALTLQYLLASSQINRYVNPLVCCQRTIDIY